MEVKGPAIVIVGCGPGSPDYLTPLARQAVERAEVLIGASRLLDLFAEHPGERVVVGADMEEVLREIGARRHRKVAVLVTGDIGLCSLAQPVLRRFGREACELVPGVSSIQVAFARVGLDWLDARIIDAHGASPDIESGALAEEAKIAILGGKLESLRWVARVARMLGDGYRIYVCENLTLPEEKIRSVRPAELDGLDTSSRTVFLLIKETLLK
jgi:cobalt-precorrin-7 (C5)-methyltransferase